MHCQLLYLVLSIKKYLFPIITITFLILHIPVHLIITLHTHTHSHVLIFVGTLLDINHYSAPYSKAKIPT